jgi:hypothetical protein
MLAEMQAGRSRRITVGADKAYDTKDFVSTVRELNVTPHVTKNDKGRSKQSGAQNNAPGRLCHQPEPPMAGRKGLRVAEANRPATPSQVARSGESGLAVRLQLRSAQPEPIAAPDSSTAGNAPAAARLSNGCKPRG